MFPTTTLLNQALMLAADQESMPSSHMAFYNQDSSLCNVGFLPYGCQQPPPRPPIHSSPSPPYSPVLFGASSQLREATTSIVISRYGHGAPNVDGQVRTGAPSLQKSSNCLWPFVEDGQDPSRKRSSSTVIEEKHRNNPSNDKTMINNSNGNINLSVAGMKMKKVKTRKKVREPRFCFKTMSDVDVLDDGYKWRKYGQKVVKNTQHPRSYYRCTQDNCRVKKRVERLAEDPRMVITTYEGRHAHSPSHDTDDQQSSCQFNFFW